MKRRMTVTIPEDLKRAAQAQAEREGVTLDRFVVRALAARVDAAAVFAERGKGGDTEWAVAFLEARPE